MRANFFRTALVVAVAFNQQDAFAQCEDGQKLRADLGVGALLCVGPSASCEVSVPSADGVTHRFSVEPEVTALSRQERDGFRVGDIIVAIDGLLITTTAGGGRFARPEAAGITKVVVRRDASLRTLQLRAVPGCGVGALSVR